MKNLVLAAAISTLPAALHAQDGTSDNPDKAAEIVVTAAAVAKLDVPLAETPQNVTVITQQAFERQNADERRGNPALHTVRAGRAFGTVGL